MNKTYFNFSMMLTALLLVTLALPLFGKETWSVGPVNGTTQLLHNGKAVYPYILSLGLVETKQQQTTGKAQILLATKHGKTNVYMIGIPLLWGDSTQPKAEKVITQQFDFILSVDPHAYFLPRMQTWHYDYVPDFLRTNTAEKNLSSNGSHEQPSLSSKKFQAESVKAVRRTVEFLEKRYGDHMMGYSPGAGQHNEYQYIDYNVKGNFLGYDYSTRLAFQKFLKAKYGTEAKLAAAWHRKITFDRVLVPGPTRRRSQPGMQFHTPRREQDVIDFNEFINQEMADTLIRLCSAVRSVTKRTRITGAFYGYSFEILAVANGPSQVGHYAFKRVLASDAVDVICGPFSYWSISRCPGCPATSHTVGETMQKHGKLWLNEDDTQTPTSIRRGGRSDGTLTKGQTRTVEETTQLLRRNLSFCFARNYGVWWHDLFACGRWDDDSFWVEKERFEKLFRTMNPSPYQPDVLMTFGEEMVPFIAGRVGAVSGLGEMMKMRTSVANSGCAIGTYLLNSVIQENVPSKLDVHTSAVALTREQRAALKARAAKVPTVWMWQPGYIDLTTGEQSTKYVEELTGFKVEQIHVFNWGIAALPSGLDLGMWDCLINREANLPALAPVPEKGDLVLANWRFPGGKPAVILRPGKNGKPFSVFCGAPWLNAEVIRNLARLAGAHVYSERNASVDVRGGFAAITVGEEGLYPFNVGGTKRWYDYVTGKEAGRGPELLIRSPKNHTHLFIDETVKAQLDGRK